jgi:hypothetical protein
MKQLVKHFPHYFSLIGIFLAGFLGIIIFSYDRIFQIAILVAVAVAYVIWGMVHHLIHKDLYLEVVLEYLAIATLGLIVVLSLILNT